MEASELVELVVLVALVVLEVLEVLVGFWELHRSLEEGCLLLLVLECPLLLVLDCRLEGWATSDQRHRVAMFQIIRRFNNSLGVQMV